MPRRRSIAGIRFFLWLCFCAALCEGASRAADRQHRDVSWQARSRVNRSPSASRGAQNVVQGEVNYTTSGREAGWHLRSHTRNRNLHPMFVCANPKQSEVTDPKKCRTLWPNSTQPLRDSWGGGNQLRCIGRIEQPECIRLGTICLNGEVEIPPKPCYFPFEYNGIIRRQCVVEEGYPAGFCFDAPNFKVPCSPDAKLAGCVDDGPTLEAYEEDKLKLPCECERHGYWNAPPSGGTTLTIFGAGFGEWEKPCDQAYMDCLRMIILGQDNEKLATMDRTCIVDTYGESSEYLPADQYTPPGKDDFPQNCAFHSVEVGHTKGQVTWTSDSTLSLLVPPGIGKELPLTVRTGRFQYSQNDFRLGMLDGLFTYDGPMESSVDFSNSPAVGDGPITVLGRHFGITEHCINIRLGNTFCSSSMWMSETSVVCIVPPGTGSTLGAQVELMECPPGLDLEQPQLIMPYQCRVAMPVSLSKAFSYDLPVVSMVYPNNAPPSGYSLLTISGKNFGPFLDDPWRVERVDPETIDEEVPTILPVSYGVQAYSLARYPASSYYKSLHALLSNKQRAASYAGGLEFVCVSDQIDEYDGLPCMCIGPECNHPDCGPIRATFNCRAARYLCAGDTPRSYKECGSIAGGTTCISDVGYSPGECVPVALGTGCQYWEERCQPSHPNYNPDECVPAFMLAACQYSIQPDGVTCADVPEHSENEALCQSGQHSLVSGTECVTYTWISDSSLLCRTSPGLGQAQDMIVQVNSQRKSLSRAFSYDMPVISSIPENLMPASGGTSVTIYGKSFGIFPCNRTWCSRAQVQGLQVSHRGRVGKTACLKTTWMSDSSIGCSVAPGIGTDNLIGMTVLSSTSAFLPEYLLEYAENNDGAEDAGAGAGKVAYQPPMVLNVTPANAPTVKKDFIIQIDGKSFGLFDSTPGAALVGTACSGVRWTSDSTLTCAVSHGLGSPPCNEYETEEACYAAKCSTEAAYSEPLCRIVAVEVGGQRGSLVGLFSFDGPEVNVLTPANAPATGGLNVTLFGANFGMHASYAHKAVAGVRPCTSTLWYSDSSISCEVAPFTGKGYRMGVYALLDPVGGDFKIKSVQIRSPMLSYDKPHITAFEPATSPAAADLLITAIGSNFGAAECGGDCKDFAQLQLTLGDTICLNTQWMADSSIVCALAPYPQRGSGVGQDLPPRLEVGKQRNDRDILRFCFDMPLVKGFTSGYVGKQNMKAYSINGPAEGGHQVTVFGRNFGVLDYSPSVTIGDSHCRAKSWVSDTSILCTTTKATRFLAGANLELPLRVEVGLEHYPRSYQTGLYTEAYNYDPVIYRDFEITNVEINFLCFVGAFTAAIFVIMMMNRYYARSWPRIPPGLATQRQKHPHAYVKYSRDFEPMFPQLPQSTHALQKALHLKREKNPHGHLWPAEIRREGHRHHKLGTKDDDEEIESESSSAPSDADPAGDFYDFEAGAAPRDRDKVLEEAFAKGMAAATSVMDVSAHEARAELLHTNRYYLPTLRSKVHVTRAGESHGEDTDAETKLADASIRALAEEIDDMEAKIDRHLKLKLEDARNRKQSKRTSADDLDSRWSEVDELRLAALMEGTGTREAFTKPESTDCRRLLLDHFGANAICEHNCRRSECTSCWVFSQAQCLHRVELAQREVSMRTQLKEMRARMNEAGPGGVQQGWTLLSSHVGDIPESVQGPANVGFGGGGRKTHWELMERSRHEEKKKAKNLETTVSQDSTGASVGEPRYGDVKVERLHPKNDAGGIGQSMWAAGLVSEGATESGEYVPERSGPEETVLDAVVIEGLEEK